MSDADNKDATAETTPSTDGGFVEFAGKLFSKENAEYLWSDITYVKALFGAFDGLIISYSTFKCYFDLACPPGVSASNAMHEWMSSPLVFLGVMAETAFIMTLSCIGTLYDDDDKNKMKATLAWFWPYFRDAFKGLKFAYRGVRSVIQVALLLGVDLQSAFLPLGVVLGLLASANRVWYRNQITDPRKKYQKKNTTLLGMAQNLDSNIDYELCPMVIGPIEQNKIAIAINETDNLLEYKVYSPSGDLQSGTIDLTNELHYKKRLDDQHKPIAPTFESLIAEGYSGAIRFHIAQKGHISNLNHELYRHSISPEMSKEAFYRHAISVDMGACCSTVMFAWPKDDGSNINLEPYDSGYIRVINEHGGHSGLVYAKKNKCCSLFLSELPPDPSKISLGDSDAAYVRIFNEEKGFNRLYYLNKKTGEWNELQARDKTLRQYDSKIYSTKVPRDLSTQELKEISSLTTFKKPEFKHHTVTYTWEQLLIDAEKLDQYDAMITETCRVRIMSSQPSLAEKVKVHDLKEILIIHTDNQYEIVHCDESGAYEEELVTDGEMLKLLSKYQPGSYVQTKDHQQINKFLASKRSNSRVTCGATQALSIKQLEWIALLTKHKHHEKQHLPSSRMRMGSAFLGGLIDGLYTYMAAIGLVALCPPLLYAMIGFCSLFTLLCVINRCFEEYEFQQEFIRSRLNVELALLHKEFESVISELDQLKLKSLDNCKEPRQDDLILHLEKHLIPKCKQMQKEYVSSGVLSYRRALLSGLRAGLYFYSAVCSIEFAAAAFCAIAMTTFPPALIVAGFALGIVALIGFILHALYTKSLHVEKTEEQARCCVTVILSEPGKLEQDEVIRSGNILLFRTEKGINIGYCSQGGIYQQTDVSDKAVIGIVTLFIKRLGATPSGGIITKPADLEKITTFMKSLKIRDQEKAVDKDRCVAVIVSEPTDLERAEVIKSGKILFINTKDGLKVEYCLDGKNCKQKMVSYKEIIDIVKRFPKGGAITQSADLAEIEMFVRLLGIRSLEKKESAYEDLNTFVRTCKGNLMAEKAISKEKGVDALYRSMEFDSLVQMRAQEVFEWFRSFFSGLSKGQKVVDYLNPFHEVDAHGHYSDSPLMVILGFIVSLFYAVVYALRAFAKNWRGSNDVPRTPVREDDPRKDKYNLHLALPSSVGPSEPPLSPSSAFSSPPPPLSPLPENLDDPSDVFLHSERTLSPLGSPATTLPNPVLRERKSSAPPLHYSSPAGVSFLSSSPRRHSGSHPSLLFGCPDRGDWGGYELRQNILRNHSASTSVIDMECPSSPVASVAPLGA